MEDNKAKIIAACIIITLIISVIVTRTRYSNAFYLITGANGAAILAEITIFLLRNQYNKRRRLLETRLVSESGLRVSESELRTEYSILGKVAGVPTIFQHREIEEATDGFKSKNLLGKGASGQDEAKYGSSGGNAGGACGGGGATGDRNDDGEISSSQDSSGIGASPVTQGDDSVHSSASCSIYL
ncbi:hypothetical protein RHSIM_Rhsim01G0078100 [Rhododendron simsii]|uniref:Uncharacterized protein n=1 Tax=Rhododendron simsii TaxID=118357 RepID=A0A834HH05_RHOSS|nr:hypothetical protein RHSIM_Rhsim01G0078100 [Rhododendron simsii]